MIKTAIYVDAENIKMSGGFGMRYDVLVDLANSGNSIMLRANCYIAEDHERIKTDPEYVKPLPGVYGGWITVGGKRWKTMVNVGHNPTYNYRYDLSIEAYILDFNQGIYGQDVLLEFAVYLRPEQKFSSAEELSAQLIHDRERVRKELQCTQNPS